jgi:putative redox protein
MVKITGNYQGELRCEAVHGPSGQTLATDAPKDNLGRGEAFSPTDLLATSLATCIVTTLAIVAKKQGLTIDLAGLKFSVTKEMSTDAPRRVVRLATELWVPLKKTPELAALFEKTARHCPVHVSLSPSIEIPITFHWSEN